MKYAISLALLVSTAMWVIGMQTSAIHTCTERVLEEPSCLPNLSIDDKTSSVASVAVFNNPLNSATSTKQTAHQVNSTFKTHSASNSELQEHSQSGASEQASLLKNQGESAALSLDPDEVGIFTDDEPQSIGIFIDPENAATRISDAKPEFLGKLAYPDDDVEVESIFKDPES